MKRTAAMISVFAMMIVTLLAVQGFADETNDVPVQNKAKVEAQEDGPLKNLVTVVLTTGSKKQLDTNLALQLGLATTNNKPFDVFELLDEHSTRRIRVSQQREKTDIIFEYSDNDAGTRYYQRFLTSTQGGLLRATTMDMLCRYHADPITNEWTKKYFQREVDFWTQKLKVPVKKSD
jgi:hypothetical protein